MSESDLKESPKRTPWWARIGQAVGLQADADPPRISCQMLPFEQDGIETGSAILEISGRLDRRAYRRIAAEADRLIESNVRSAGVIVDSGGGAMAGLDDAAAALLRLRAAVGPGNFQSFAVRAGSAGYLLLATAGKDRIFAGSGSDVGGLGAIMAIEDSSRLFDEGLLLKEHYITSSAPLKAVGAPGNPVTEEMLEFQGEQVDAAGDTYLRLVAAVRGDSLEDVRRMKGAGGMYAATNALQIGLISAIITETEFRERVESGPTRRTAMATTTPAAEGSAPEVEATTPTESGSPPSEPAAPEVEGSTSPDVAALTAAVAAQGQQIQALTAQLAEDRKAGEAKERQVKVDDGKRRISALVGRSITRDAADSAIAAMEAAAAAGGEIEALVAQYEALPAIDQQADLMTEVTFTPPGQAESQTQRFDLSMFSSPGRNGEGRVAPATAERANLILGALAETPKGRAFETLGKLREQMGLMGMGGN